VSVVVYTSDCLPGAAADASRLDCSSSLAPGYSLRSWARQGALPQARSMLARINNIESLRIIGSRPFRLLNANMSRGYFDFLAFSALYFAHRAFVAFEILALAAADIVLFRFTLVVVGATGREAECPFNTAIAPCIPFNWCCSLPSSCRRAARMSMKPPRIVDTMAEETYKTYQSDYLQQLLNRRQSVRYITLTSAVQPNVSGSGTPGHINSHEPSPCRCTLRSHR
jgi:hypothetical protein